MDALDIVLIVLCLVFAVSGYRQGFLVGVLSYAGLIGGAFLGATFAPSLHRALGFHGDGTLFGVVAFVVLAAVGLTLGTAVGAFLRNRLTWRPARLLDALAGTAVGVFSVLLVSWLLGTAATQTQIGSLNREVNNSEVLQAIDGVMPQTLSTVFGPFRRLLNASGFPQVFSSIGVEPLAPVAPPNSRLARSAVVRRTEPSVVKITGVAPSCSRQLEGSGFVISGQHVMTNAHVVAGVTNPVIHTTAGPSYPARVVLYDPNRDVAVLDAPSLPEKALGFAGPVDRGTSAIVLGYPENGPFTANAARVRAVQQARGTNIYQDQLVTRQVYEIDARVRPGNSGGPLLSPAGLVDGVVFAASTDQSMTGYALSAREVAGDRARGAAATTPVSTHGCD